MRMILLFVVALLPKMSRADEWTPPENPDVNAIRHEAKVDKDRGRYETALAKHVWYHENALTLGTGQGGVRLSFALSAWLELGEVYPPALKKMREVRDETESRIRDENRVRVSFGDFHDFVALNRTLRDEQRTANTFAWLDQNDAEDAQRVFLVAKPSLIKQKNYQLYLKYTDLNNAVDRIGENYERGIQLAEERFGKDYRDHTEKTFLNASTTLVAVLVKSDQPEDAKRIAEQFREIVSDETLSEKLDVGLKSAMDGVVPKPWP
ncbi:MAG: hypothetical protein AAGJ40_21360 [Planctomycetota bacterium]